MGDRANVVIDDSGSRVFLYTHWNGNELPETLRQALERHERWDDAQYLARIVFQKMVGGDNGVTGYGITARVGDNSYPLLIVDVGNQMVKLEAEERGGALRGKQKEFTFEDYIALPEASWGDLDSGRREDNDEE